MRGKLSDQPVAETARRLSNDEVTGALEVTGASGVARVFFRSGAVYWAMSPAPRARLGDRLVNAGFISQAQLDAALERQQNAEERTKLGALLVDEQLVNRDVIRVFVQEQILDALFDLVRWEAGDWVFHPGDAVEDKLPIDVPVSQMLVEVARRQSEWDQIQRSIPTLDAVPDHKIGGNATTAALEQDEFTMLASIDGSRSVRELANDLGYSEIEAARIVYGLTLLGIVEIVGEEPDEIEPEPPALEDDQDVESPDRADLDAALADVLHATGEEPESPAPAAGDDEAIDVGEALEHALFGDHTPEPAPAPTPTPEPIPDVAAAPAAEDGGLQVTVHFALDEASNDRPASAQPASTPAAPATPPPPAVAKPAAAAASDEPEPWVFETDDTSAAPPDPSPSPASGGTGTDLDSDLAGLDDFFSGGASTGSGAPATEPSTASIADDLDAITADLDMDPEPAPSPTPPPGSSVPGAPLPGASIQTEPDAATEPAGARGARGDVSEFLRELTQLNVEGEGGAPEPEDDEDEDRPATPPPPPSRPEPRDDKGDDKKKKGLFGWGR